MKVLVIDDDAAILEFVSIAFDIGWPDASLITAYGGQEGFELFKKVSPDIIILDLGLPDIDGFKLLNKIRKNSQVPVIIITVRDNEQDIVKGLSLGADDYLIKPFGQLELLARVKNIFRRISGVDNEGNKVCGQLKLNVTKGELVFHQSIIPLTRTECLIMHELMINAGRVVGYDDLAEIIWGDSYPNAVETLRVYIRRLRKKVENNNIPRIIHSRSGIGYYLEPI